MKNGEVISDASTTNYSISQRIMDRETGTYESILEGLVIGSLLGNFTCIVENARGRANQTVELNSKETDCGV